MSSLFGIDAVLLGVFGFATIHYVVQWWLSRDEPLLLWFAAMCGMFAAFTVAMLGRYHVTTVSQAQHVVDAAVTLGVLGNALTLQFLVQLAGRRDRAFRLIVIGTLVILAIANLWVPLRGTVLSLETVEAPGWGTLSIPIRTPAGAYLALLYASV